MGSRQLWKKLVIIWDDNNRAAAATRAICVHFETIRRRSAGFELPNTKGSEFAFMEVYGNIFDRMLLAFFLYSHLS